MKIRDLYRAILEAVGAVVSEDDLISMTRPDDDPIPLMVDEKRLALPSDRLLNQGAFNEGTGVIAFHPMCENVVLDHSPVLEKLQTAMIFRLTWVLRELMAQLVTIASNTKLHKSMKMGAHGLLSALPDADTRTRNDFTKVIENTSATGAKKLISLYLRKGGVYEGAKVNRLGKFYPAIVDGLDQEKRTLNGVSLRKADIPAFLALIEYVLPDYQDADRYAAASNSMVAPSFHALVKTFFKVANQINKIIDTHEDHLDRPDLLRIRTDWIEHVQDLSPYREQIPVLPGNDGSGGTKVQRQAPTPVNRPAVSDDSPPWAEPEKPAAAPVKKGGAKDVHDALAALKGLQQGQQRSGFGANSGWARQSQGPDPRDLPPWARPQPAQTVSTTRWGNRGGGGGGRSGGSL